MNEILFLKQKIVRSIYLSDISVTDCWSILLILFNSLGDKTFIKRLKVILLELSKTVPYLYQVQICYHSNALKISMPIHSHSLQIQKLADLLLW